MGSYLVADFTSWPYLFPSVIFAKPTKVHVDDDTRSTTTTTTTMARYSGYDDDDDDGSGSGNGWYLVDKAHFISSAILPCSIIPMIIFATARYVS